MKKIFTKVKDYFTANACRKVFFISTCLAVFWLILYAVIRLSALWSVAMFCAVVAAVASLGDSMQSRVTFIRKVQAMQYEHLQTLYQQQQAGQATAMTPTFTPAEQKYLKRKKYSFVLVILLKMAFALTFISLLFVYF